VNKSSLAQRRAELVELCAMQRSVLSQECAALRLPLGGGALSGMPGMRKTGLLALAGAVIGMAVIRPGRIMSMAAAALSTWKLARRVLPMLSRSSAD
jgi:hypothetical protein